MAFLFRGRINWRRNARRVGVLVAAGLAYNYVVDPTRGWEHLRYTGVLQMYAALVLLIGVLHLVLRRAGHWAGFTLAVSIAMTAYWYGVSRHCPGGMPQPTCNPTLAIDTTFIPIDHLYRLGQRGFEPEGVLGVLGALTTASAGVTAGHLIKERGNSKALGRRLLLWSLITARARPQQPARLFRLSRRDDAHAPSRRPRPAPPGRRTPQLDRKPGSGLGRPLRPGLVGARDPA